MKPAKPTVHPCSGNPTPGATAPCSPPPCGSPGNQWDAGRAVRHARGLAFASLMALSLGGCALLGGGKGNGATQYAPDPRVQAEPDWPRVAWSLTVAPPTATRALDSARIAVRPAPQELQVYKGAQWAKRPSEMLEDAVLRTLEDSDRIAVVTRQGTGIATDYRLVLDVRRFESDYASGQPAATIEVNAKLLHGTASDVVASRTFLQAVPAGDSAVPAVIDAFEQALAGMARDLAGWTLATGTTRESAPRR